VEAEVSDGGKPRLIIDGAAFDTLEGFLGHFSEVASLEGVRLSHSLDAFNDVLRGGFGTPEGGFILEWRNHARSRRCLGHPETVRWLESMLESCHPNHSPDVLSRLDAARSFEGPTVFDFLVQIIADHGPGGDESEDGVELVLA